MTLHTFTTVARVTRRVEVGPDRAVTVRETASPFFEMGVVDRYGGSSSDSSPRNDTAQTVRYPANCVMEPVGGRLQAGDRFDIRGDFWEVLGDSRLISDGPGRHAWESSASPVERLYPYVGELQEQGGILVTGGLLFSAYSPSEGHTTRGTYDDFVGECSIEWRNEVRVNRQLAVGDSTFKILSADLDLQGRFCSLRLRRAGIRA